MKIGFACVWGKVPKETWSHIPWHVREALMRQTEVSDLGIEYRDRVRTFLKYLYVRRRRGHWLTTYQWSPSWDRRVQERLQKHLSDQPVDAVIEIGDLARLDAPYYVYQDLNYEVLEKYYDLATGVPGFVGIDMDIIKRRRERENRIYESASGIFTMSRWLADSLVEWKGIPREKISVVYAGLTSIGAVTEGHGGAEGEMERRSPARLLFVGRDFFRKGGNIVVEALAELRRGYSPDIELTIVGPDKWPLPGGVPAGVNFLGKRLPAEVAPLYYSHDLFVMPSQFEAFGIAFVEALANGMPVIGRSTFAMPEIITPGENGALVDSGDPSELASAIVSVLEDPAIRELTARNAGDVKEHFSWDAVVGRMLDSVAATA